MARKYRETHKEEILDMVCKWAEENHDKCQGYWRKYSRSEAGKERAKRWRDGNPDWVREYGRKYFRQKRENDPKWRVRMNMSRRILGAIRDKKSGRSWESLVGYTLGDLMQNLESKFQPGMTWDNYGKKGWHIDHIRPVDAFEFESLTDDQVRECWALSNLQPLWAHDNFTKGAKWQGVDYNPTHRSRKE
jgi:hypothetical protein